MEVLVGYDGSKEATEAVRWAALLAGARHDMLRILRAWEYPSSAALPIPNPAPLSPPADVEHALRADLGHVARMLPTDLVVRTELVRGPGARALLDAGGRPGVRALVVGGRGHGGFAELLLGSVARACLDHSSVPVVIVPAGFTVGDRVGRVLVGLDGSENAREALAWATETARALDVPITAALAYLAEQAELRPNHAALLRSRATEDLERWCADHLGSDDGDRMVLLEGDARRVLLHAIDDEEADLVVVGSRGLGPVTRLLTGSVASALAHHSPVPVAVIRRS
jgi:nucleotide-binding universal stress UspA family protein